MRDDIYIIEVQHASDHDLDGHWYELDRGNFDYVFNTRDPSKSRLSVMEQSYSGRPVRARRIT